MCDVKSKTVATNFLKVLVLNKEAILVKLNRIYGLNYDVFFHVKVL